MAELALIDGDVLLHLACPSRYTNNKGVTVITLDDTGKKVPKEFTKDENAEYLEKCWIILQKNLKELLDTLFVSDYLMAVKSPTNFRDEIYTDYKAHRKNKKTPSSTNETVQALRKLSIQYGLAIEAHDREADDFIRIWAEEAKRNGDDYIVCSNDKDLKCIPGRFYDVKKKQLEIISEDTAMRLYYEQLLKGDPTDNIPGLPGVGPVGATKILENCKTEEEFQEQVIMHYLACYEDEWRDYLLSNGKMIHIQRHPNDFFTLEDWPLAQELAIC